MRVWRWLWQPGRRVRVLVAGWLVLLVGLALVGIRGAATVREHRGVAAARTAADQALGTALSAGEGFGVEVGRYRQVTSCQLNASRGGAEYQRTGQLYTGTGDERALVDRLGDRLAGTYRRIRALRGGPVELAAPGFITLRLLVTGSGSVAVEARTGCRPVDGPVADFQPPPTADDHTLAKTALLHELVGLTWNSYEVPCSGGTLRTVVASTTDPAQAATLAAQVRAAIVELLSPVLDRSDLYVQRQRRSGATLAAHTGPDTFRLAATSPCRPAAQ